MKRSNHCWRALAIGPVLALCAVCAAAQSTATAGQTLVQHGDDWTKFLADSGAGTVSASDILGLGGDAVHQVENVKDVVLALRGLGGKGEKAGFGLSITPARTSLTPMDLSRYYAGGLPMRLLGALTLSYAQGAVDVSGQSLDRKALAIETSAYLRREDDPVVAEAEAFRACDILHDPGQPAANAPAGLPPQDRTPADIIPVQDDGASDISAQCREQAKKRWNASRVSLGYAGGRVSAHGTDHSLGRVWALSATYGFEHFAALKDGHALALTLRHASGEPVLQSLVAGAPEFVDRRMAALRYTVGSARFKGLIEASNAHATRPSASESVFKRALGLDVKLQDRLWLGLRVGKKRKIDGSGEETASMLSLSYSPAALLKP